MTDYGGQRTEDRGQMTEVRGIRLRIVDFGLRNDRANGVALSLKQLMDGGQRDSIVDFLIAARPGATVWDKMTAREKYNKSAE